MDDSSSLDRELQGAGAGFHDAVARAHRAIASRLFDDGQPPAELLADRYRLGGQLGRGGQGVVWRARDERLGRDVAVKILHAPGDPSSARAQSWVRHEAHMLSRIAHPHVVSVFDLGMCRSLPTDEHDEPRTSMFVVMELVPGVPLREWLEQTHPTHDEIFAIMRQIAGGLAAVHAAGLVHCDVKPGNILVAGNTAKLADFGLAHVARTYVDDVELADASDLWSGVTTAPVLGSATRTRAPVGGTPLYMPPEQFRGRRLDARTDEYALAATLFEVLFGHAPHRGASREDLYEAKLAGPPARPESRVVRAAYDALARSLSPDPGARHGSAAALIDAVDRERRRARARRFRGAMAVAVMGAVALAWQTAAPSECAGRSRHPVDPQRNAALRAQLDDTSVLEPGASRRALSTIADHERALANAWTQVCARDEPGAIASRCLERVQANTDAVLTAIEELDGAESRRATALVERLSDPRDCIDGDADPTDVGPALDEEDPTLDRAWARLSGARADIAVGHTTAALAALTELAADPDTGALADEVDIARTTVLTTLGRYEESVEVAKALYERAAASDNPRIAACAANDLAFVLGKQQYRFDEGMTWIRHAEAQRRRVDDPRELTCDPSSTAGAILFAQGRQREARTEFERALARASDDERRTRRRAMVHENLGIALVVAGDPDGLEHMFAAHELRETELGEDHPETIDTLANLGNALARFGHHEQARARLERALELREAVHGPDAFENARLLSVLADLDREQGDLVAAEAKLRRASALRERMLPADHPDRAMETFEWFDLLVALGRLEDAQRLLDRQTDRFAVAFAPDDPANLHLLRARGLVALRQHRPAAAAELLGEAVRRATQVGHDGEELVQWVVEAAEAEASLGHKESVRRHLDAAADMSEWARPEVRASMSRLRATL